MRSSCANRGGARRQRRRRLSSPQTDERPVVNTSAFHITPALIFSLFVSGCVSSPRFTMSRETGTDTTDGTYEMYEEGVASYYADEFNGRKTSDGETYDMNAFTAAHRTLPFNTKV